MFRVKTFTTEVKIFHTREELNRLDEQINKFISGNGIKKLIGVSDACTTDNTGATIGIIRTIAYEES